MNRGYCPLLDAVRKCSNSSGDMAVKSFIGILHDKISLFRSGAAGKYLSLYVHFSRFLL